MELTEDYKQELLDLFREFEFYPVKKEKNALTWLNLKHEITGACFELRTITEKQLEFVGFPETQSYFLLDIPYKIKGKNIVTRDICEAVHILFVKGQAEMLKAQADFDIRFFQLRKEIRGY